MEKRPGAHLIASPVGTLETRLLVTASLRSGRDMNVVARIEPDWLLVPGCSFFSGPRISERGVGVCEGQRQFSRNNCRDDHSDTSIVRYEILLTTSNVENPRGFFSGSNRFSRVTDQVRVTRANPPRNIWENLPTLSSEISKHLMTRPDSTRSARFSNPHPDPTQEPGRVMHGP